MYTVYRYRLLCAGLIACVILSSCVSTPPAQSSTAAAPQQETRKDTPRNTAAAQSAKDLLLIFTGSDWSAEAQAFSKNVLTESFKAAINQDYTVRFVDLPRNPAEAERAAVQKNYLLFSEYAVPDVPFVVLQTADQDMYASAVIEPNITTAKQLTEKIKQLSAGRRAVVEARNAIAVSSGKEKALAIDAFLNIVGNGDARRYDSLRMQVPALDPDNETGLKGKYVLISADIRAKGFAQQGDFLKACDEYKTAAETGDLSSSELQLAWYLAAYSSLMAETVETETVIGYLQQAIAAAPQSEAVPQINQAIQKLQKERK
ncbi:MAG: tetratricopeptide repeat protein [Treponema sp.]|uniref:tetratricopeptide repeat protein n=1 Tax=Treponema sp. TaxID=166 RepID=UPI003FA25CFB